ncbi:hypothetical protein AADZ90_008450 [Aestuariibius sp. 2305UL40-4]|uniref:hypothetical protein n=1 Tax=Aestuariibius violaceus TaxID=3234132 RepID=UPI00345E5950
MTVQRPGIFLAKASYRQRRMRDAARMLPVIGAALLLLPMAWSGPAEGAAQRTSVAGLYLFAVWIGLVAAAALLARPLQRPDVMPEDREAPVDEG